MCYTVKNGRDVFVSQGQLLIHFSVSIAFALGEGGPGFLLCPI